MIPLFKALKWITVQGFKLIGKLLEMGKDKKQIEKGTDEISEGLKKIDKEKSKLTGLFEKSVEDTEKPEIKIAWITELLLEKFYFSILTTVKRR